MTMRIIQPVKEQRNSGKLLVLICERVIMPLVCKLSAVDASFRRMALVHLCKQYVLHETTLRTEPSSWSTLLGDWLNEQVALSAEEPEKEDTAVGPPRELAATSLLSHMLIRGSLDQILKMVQQLLFSPNERIRSFNIGGEVFPLLQKWETKALARQPALGSQCYCSHYYRCV